MAHLALLMLDEAVLLRDHVDQRLVDVSELRQLLVAAPARIATDRADSATHGG